MLTIIDKPIILKYSPLLSLLQTSSILNFDKNIVILDQINRHIDL